ncbi:MAG: hypothetical protein ACYSX0_15725 [Planctomycetota bacterium]|jgi:hypothetical protein
MYRSLTAALLLTLCACKSVDPKIEEMALEVEKADLFPVWLFDGKGPSWTYRVTEDGTVYDTTLTGWSLTRADFPGHGEQNAGKQMVDGGRAHTLYFGIKKDLYLKHFGLPSGAETYDPPIRVLPAFPDIDKNWKWQGMHNGSPSNAECEVVEEKEVQSDAGVFDALHLREKHPRKGVTIDRWFARGVGLARIVKTKNNREVLRLDLVSFTGQG